ncbi:MAG: LysE family translocator, partial [Anaerolineales bacterium]|nr:LysE family translocator [Anaerolineales bacterium]
MILQVAIGPVFFYILNLTLQRSLQVGYAAVLAAVLVDYLYITLAVLGAGKLLEMKGVKRILGILSSVVLSIFGWLMIESAWKGGILPGSVGPGG